MTSAELEVQLAAADATYQAWRERSVHERAAVMQRASEIFTERRDELAEIIALEMGKSLPEALGEVDFSAAIISYYAAHGP